MTVTDDPTTGAPDDAPVAPITSGALAADDAQRLHTEASAAAEAATSEVADAAEAAAVQIPFVTQLRPALAAGLTTSAAGMVVGGIFASWLARGLGVLAAGLGAGWALFAARSQRPSVVQAATPFMLLGVSLVALITAPGGPGELPTLVGDAIDAGQLIRPPVPFDPGWRVLIIVVIGTIGFGAASIALTYQRPKLAIVIPLPLVGLASITQPESEQFIAGAAAFVPTLAAIAVVFGADAADTGEFDRQFEFRRLLRGVAFGIPLIAVLVLFNSANFLFPEPVYDPDDKPQKPRAAPLSAAEDRVLFEVDTGSGLTGPWRTGALDVYEDDAWLIAGFSADRLIDVPDDGEISGIRAGTTLDQVTITVRDLGDSAVLPILGGTTQVLSDRDLAYDPRMDTLRVPSGRVPAGLVYTLQVPHYATDEQLEAVDAAAGSDFDDQLLVPEPPALVRSMLDQAPDNRWLQLDFLRNELLSVVTASGAGAPVAVSTERVVELLSGETATPFEIVAAEALLARWAGVPSRIGFGFDGLNAEDGIMTVRPRNAAQWLEVWFDGYGWVPLIGTPLKAESSLDTDPNARFDPTIQPSDDVAVEVYLPFETEDLTQLYERIRETLLRYLPIVVVIVFGWIGWPIGAKALRRSRRRRWAATRGPRTQIAVEYAEFRDTAIDLGVGDVYDTPLEYLSKVRDDKEHRELAWLASRALFGDLRRDVSDEDVLVAEELSTSLRRRLSAGQPLQLRMLAAVSRASLAQPYTEEVPNFFHVHVPGITPLFRAVRRIPLPRRGRRRQAPRIRLAGDPR